MNRIVVSPNKILYLEETHLKEGHLERSGEVQLDKSSDLAKAFMRGSGYGLLFLNRGNTENTRNIEKSEDTEESILYWQEFCRLYLSRFVAIPDLDSIELSTIKLDNIDSDDQVLNDKNLDNLDSSVIGHKNLDQIKIELTEEDIDRFIQAVPLIKGAEYIDKDCLINAWQQVEKALKIEIQESGLAINEFFTTRYSDWNLLGKICFHLAENKNSQSVPFAFLATYAHKVDKRGKTRHLPLGKALKEYSGSDQRNMLLRLLEPLSNASKESSFIKIQIDSGDIYHPLAWTAAEAYEFLKDIPLFEKSGIAVKIPNWWKAKHTNKPTIKIHIGEETPSKLGFDGLLDFKAYLSLNDEPLTEEEMHDLISRSENLVFFKGQWVEVDKEKLENLLAEWKNVSKQAREGGITFADSMRLMSGMSHKPTQEDIYVQERVISGKWLKKILEEMRSPQANNDIEKILDNYLQTKLRPYQLQGVSWLNLLNQLKLGAILADDMGLGKTLQVISLLLLKKQFKQENYGYSNDNIPNNSNKNYEPSILILPTSLIDNWKNEINKFAPTLKYWIIHASADGINELPRNDFDLVITTYGYINKIRWLAEKKWELIILDEAQAIKNPLAKQTKAIKALRASHRLALTGTPVENSLSDLWSLFDFVSPGLLGSSENLNKFIKQQQKTKGSNSSYAALRSLVSPYILRRMKTDKRIISDLPDKTELKTYCSLSKQQMLLYQQAVDALSKDIKETDGIERRGIIFAYLMRFKQICNHPSHWLKDGLFEARESGKFTRLKEICQVIIEKQEKLLIFTQFQEITGILANFLSSIFGCSGLVLHGGTAIRKRAEMVKAFGHDDGPPFFVLSLKAGGVGLNLTAASHVIHFDRWWNPAVENQATDRAFRIGQKRNVLVHKFICKGTLEDRIDQLIDSKQNIANEILSLDSGATMLSELSNDDLLKIVSLDINSAIEELQE